MILGCRTLKKKTKKKIARTSVPQAYGQFRPCPRHDGQMVIMK